MYHGPTRLAWTVSIIVLLMFPPQVAAQGRGALHRRHAQVGLASFYGPGFNGDRTASGEIFNERKLVAAHRSLPFGSVVRITNLHNGRKVTLRIIDRGPYGRNRRKGCIIDVSKGAARRLRFVEQGLVPVRVDIVRLGERGARSDPVE